MARPSAPLIISCIAALLLAIPAEASAFKYTHRVTATATLTDNWVLTDPDNCGENGSGSLTIQMKTVASTRIRPFIDKVGSRPVLPGTGLWVLAVPGGGGYTHMGPRKTKGTLTKVDNTAPVGTDCDSPRRDDCGTFQLKNSGSQIKVGGYDKRRLYGNAFVGGGLLGSSWNCHHGSLRGWSFPLDAVKGDNKFGDFLFKMPSLKSFKKKRSLTLTRSEHVTSTSPSTGPSSYTDDVTRSMTIKIEKL